MRTLEDPVGEPLGVARCHRDFCQTHTGSAFRVSSFFAEDQVLEEAGSFARAARLHLVVRQIEQTTVAAN
jgi:hypothetical protein